MNRLPQPVAIDSREEGISERAGRSPTMSALDDKSDWHEPRRGAARDPGAAIGVDQHGRPVYADRCVVVPGTKRPDGTRRKDLKAVKGAVDDFARRKGRQLQIAHQYVRGPALFNHAVRILHLLR